MRAGGSAAPRDEDELVETPGTRGDVADDVAGGGGGGLSLEAAGSALCGAGTSANVLLACTFVMGLGIAILQPALPTLVRRWKPNMLGTATDVQGNGLLIGEVLAASLTFPVVLKVTGSWQGSLSLWSAP